MMILVAKAFAQMLPHVFVLTVFGIVWDMVIRAFKGWF